MSATNRPKKDGTKTVRDPNDHYRTPGWATKLLLQEPSFSPLLFTGASVLDPGCGTGAITQELVTYSADRALNWTVVGVESDNALFCRALAEVKIPTAATWGKGTALSIYRGDALNDGRVDADIVIGNPPYSQAAEWVRYFTSLRQGGRPNTVAFLLRLNFLGSAKKRLDILQGPMTPDVYVLSKRPSFTGDGKTDATEYGWFVWPRDREVVIRGNARDSGIVKVLGC
jgi:SAM-dependent methyltransferase